MSSTYHSPPQPSPVQNIYCSDCKLPLTDVARREFTIDDKVYCKAHYDSKKIEKEITNLPVQTEIKE